MKPSTLRCLQLLRAHESVTTHDFLVGGCGSRFGARLCELRHDFGCVIEEHKLSDRSGSRYRLIAEPDASPAAIPPAPHAGEQPAPRTDAPGQATTSRDSHTEGDTALTTVTASTQARGNDSTGTDRRRERNGTFEAGRRPEPLTGPCLMDKPAMDRAEVPACHAAPASGSRTDAAHAGIASAWPGLITPSLPGATPGPAIEGEQLALEVAA